MCPGPSASLAVPAFVNGCPIGRRHAAFGISSAKLGRTTPQISSTQTPANIPRRTFIKPPDKAKDSAELPTGKAFTLGNGIENRYSRQAQLVGLCVLVMKKSQFSFHTPATKFAARCLARYPLAVRKASASHSSPTTGLLFGLVLTLAAVTVYSFYARSQLNGLRALQSNLVDRDRRDSLQLLRVQNDLNSLGLAMRDMLDAREPYPLTAWSGQFQRIREDLDAALKLEESFSPAARTANQRQFLSQSLAQFWDAVDRMFELAGSGKEKESRDQIQLTLQARQAALSTAVSRLLVQNNEGEELAADKIANIYDGVQRQLYLLLGAT